MRAAISARSVLTRVTRNHENSASYRSTSSFEFTQSHRRRPCVTLHFSKCAALAAAAALALAHGFARAADVDGSSVWPAKPIRLIASLAPGTSLDTLARITAARLSMTLGQSVVVENRAGVSGNLASEGVARSAPDGHTLLFASNSITTLPAFLGPRAVDPLVSLSPVGIVATQPMIIVAHPSFAGATFADVVRPAREKPGALAYATSGMGSLAHLTAVWALSRAENGMLYVPYAGSQSFKDVLAGEVPFAFESGLPDFESINWIGLFAPAGTPPPIVARLRAELAQMAGDPEVVARLRAMGFTPASGTPIPFAEEIRRDTRRWAEIVKAADLRIE